MSQRPVFTTIGSVAVLVASGWLYVAPYLILNEMEDAAEEGHAEELNKYVDFPSLRESLKGWALSEIKAKMEQGDVPSPGASISDEGMVFAGAVVNAIVEGVVTPEGIAKILQGASPFDEPADPVQSLSDYELGYEGLSKFIVRLKPSDTEGIDLILSRHGLTWKLTAVRQRMSLAATQSKPLRQPVEPRAAAPVAPSERSPSSVEPAPAPPGSEPIPDNPGRADQSHPAAATS
ncbi:MAG: hypothetical protein RL768_2862 [Nitrospirota bacterium]